MTEKLKILIIDDDLDITNVLNMYLSQEHETMVFNDPLEALKHYNENTDYDIITVDFFMPKIRGDHLVDQILEIKPSQQFIACSGSPTEDFFIMLEKHPSCVHKIEKPFDFAEFDKTIESIRQKVI